MLPFRKSGGGFLNGVAGTIVGVKFDSKTWEGAKGKEDYTTLSVELNIKQDGADEAVQQFLSGGFLYENQGISDDGSELTADDDRPIIAEDSEIAKFLSSAVEAGLDESPFVESNLRSLAGLLNQRFVFKRVVDQDLMDRLQKAGKNPKRKGSDGKEYNRDLLLVAEYLGEAEAVATKKGAKKTTAASKPTATSTAAKGGKTNGAAKNAEVDALVEQATTVLADILANNTDKDGNLVAIPRTGLSAKIVRYSTENKFSDDPKEHNDIREALRKLIGSEDFLSQQAGWSFDAKGKGQPVSVG